MNIVKIDEDHAPCTRPHLPSFTVSAETVSFKLENFGSVSSLAVWYSNFENYTANAPMFQRMPDISIGADGTFSVSVPVGAFYTISTIKVGFWCSPAHASLFEKGLSSQPPTPPAPPPTNRQNGPQKGAFPSPPATKPSFPLPLSDDFNTYNESSEAHYFSDQIGAFEIHEDAEAKGNMVMRQMVPELPIGWSDHGSNGPMTLLGMREWQDINVEVSFRIPTGSNQTAAGCVASRVDQMWRNGIVLCVYGTGQWTLSIGGPSQSTGMPQNILAQGKTAQPVTFGAWHKLELTTVGSMAERGMFNGDTLFSNQAIRDADTGFAAMGTNAWYAIEFDDFSVQQAGTRWNPQSPCPSAKAGDELHTRNCTTNGLATTDQIFELLPSWLLLHKPSKLCVSAGAKVTLDTCDTNNPAQQFRNDYTRIRNAVVPMTVGSGKLTGGKDGSVSIGSSTSSGQWNGWSYFPNTFQLRNQYDTDTNLGYPMCLATCAS